MSHPPFRADQVGSLLRPAWLAENRKRWRCGEIDSATLRDLEDRAIRDCVAAQERIGLSAVTDGEFRRDWWHLDFLSAFEGVELRDNAGERFKVGDRPDEQPPIATVVDRIHCSKPIMAEDFAFLKSVTQRLAKMTIPSPSMLYLRGGRNAVSRDAYVAAMPPGRRLLDVSATRRCIVRSYMCERMPRRPRRRVQRCATGCIAVTSTHRRRLRRAAISLPP